MSLLKRLFKVTLLSATCFALYYFCEIKTQGFRFYELLSNLPNDPRWEVPPLSAREQEQIDHLLDQTFSYLGHGGWCHAFLGEDGKTVLKFYKHTHLRPKEMLSHFQFQNLFSKSTPWPENTPYFQEFNFKSCMLLYTQAKERTGILYVHLNKTEGKHKPVTLIDNSGVHHLLDLDKTEFVVQQKAELLTPYLQKLMEEKESIQARQCIDDLFACLLTFYSNGIRDLDKSIRKNFGFVEGKAISLDLSSFGVDESLRDSTLHKKELALKTHRLARWLRKYHPDLYTYYENRLNEF